MNLTCCIRCDAPLEGRSRSDRRHLRNDLPGRALEAERGRHGGESTPSRGQAQCGAYAVLGLHSRYMNVARAPEARPRTASPSALVAALAQAVLEQHAKRAGLAPVLGAMSAPNGVAARASRSHRHKAPLGRLRAPCNRASGEASR
jgi:hypothetical protein